MKIAIKKDNFLNSIKAVRGIIAGRGAQPILSSILIETIEKDKIKLTTTDLSLSMSYVTEAKIEDEGKIAIHARTLEDMITKLPDESEITLELNKETNTVKIQGGKTKYEVVTLNSDEFPDVFATRKNEEILETKEFEISTKDLNKAIKQTAFSAVQTESSGVLGGVCFTISDNTLEMVATDGNRLTRSRIPINSKSESATFISPYRTLIEISKLIPLVSDKTVKFTVKGAKILFQFSNINFQSGLIDGTYPKYQQLIPTTNEKIAIIDREKFINSIDRVSVMVNSRTNIIKFNFEDSSIEISTDTPESGSAKEKIDIEYNGENLLIAFNYRFVLDVLRNISESKIRFEMSTNLSASVIKPEVEDDNKETNNYLCLIMPVQVR